MRFHFDLHRASLSFPRIEQYAGLADQLRRASKSVRGLIVEGSGRQAASPKEFARHLMMAASSAEETKLWLRYAGDLGYLTPERGGVVAGGGLARHPDAAGLEGAPRGGVF